MITSVIFDLDDTLYDEIDYCRSGFATVAELLSHLPKAAPAQRIFDVIWKQFLAGKRKNTFNAALDELGMSYDEKLISKLIKIYRNHVPKITLPDDSRNVLSELSGKYTLALITDGFLPAQQLKVQALGIEKYFKCIIYTEQLGPDQSGWKPSPVGFEKLMQMLNAKPQNSAYVADNEKKDFIAPNKLGILTIQIIRPARLHTKSSPPVSSCRKTGAGAAAQHIIHEISQLPALLARL
ncbi:MAG: HAD family hydrolase [Sedimentisphaerales bacterium]